MGAWGVGNFETDQALDELNITISFLIERIRVTFTLATEIELYSGKGESSIVANIELVVHLCRHYNTFPDLELEEPVTWRDNYMNAYDNVFERRAKLENIDQEYIRMRREVVENTFSLLIELINESWNK